MTSDWVKMRTDLYRDPKVIWIADCLFAPDGPLARHIEGYMRSSMCVTRDVTRNATVGALVTVWGTIRHRGKRDDDDLLLTSAQLFTIDAIADLPGLGAAMAEVGWVIEDGDNLRFPNFFGDLNYDPAEEKRQKDAERQRRHRERIRNADSNVTVTLRSHIEKSREEKSREESKYTNIGAETGTAGSPEGATTTESEAEPKKPRKRPPPGEEVAPSVYMTAEQKAALKSEIPIREIKYWLGDMAKYAEENPVKWRKYRDHARVLRQWRRSKLEQGFIWSDEKNHYEKQSPFKATEPQPSMRPAYDIYQPPESTKRELTEEERARARELVSEVLKKAAGTAKGIAK